MTLVRRAFWGVLIAFFALPMVAMARFAFQDIPSFMLTWSNAFSQWSPSAAGRAFVNPGVLHSLRISGELTVLTAILTFVLLVPVTTYIEISAPRVKPLMTGATVLSWLVPPVALVVGVADLSQYATKFFSSPLSLTFFYVLWVLPFTYRALDGQLRLIGARNLYEAAQSVGCGSLRFFWSVVLPALRSAVFASTSLIVAFVLGEFTFAALLLKQTLPAYMVHYQTEDTQAGFALALIVMLATTALLGAAVTALRRRGIHFSATGL